MGFTPGTLIQELGHDDDVDDELLDEDYDGVPNAVVMWFRRPHRRPA